MATTTATRVAAATPYFFNQTTLRVKDAVKSIAFYREHFNMTLVAQFPEATSTIYALATIPEGTTLPAPDTDEARTGYLSLGHTSVNLWHIHGTESDETKYDSGNNEPKRGFGHLAFTTEDVYAASADLEARGVAFRKRPDEGNMKGLAFALDPDGYWLEIIKRPATEGFKGFVLNQTMLRVKDAAKSLAFYRDVLGMSVICERHFEKWSFSLYFLAHVDAGTELPALDDADGSMSATKVLKNPVVELTHNHGTETDAEFSYHDGNTDPIGFASVGFTAPDVAAALTELEAAGATVVERPSATSAVGKVRDPDGYVVEVRPNAAPASDKK